MLIKMKYGLVVLMLLVTSCATIPPQAPQLSAELGGKIATLEKSYLVLLHLYFDQKRALVNEFVNNVWAPEFASNFFSDPQIQEAWNEIVNSKDTHDRLEFLMQVGPELQLVIDQKRQEFHTPLNELERAIEASIREEFELAKSANNTLTSFLTSAAKIDENRQRYLNMARISDNKIAAVIDQTDKVLDDLVKGTSGLPEKVDDYEKKASEAIDKLNELKKRILK